MGTGSIERQIDGELFFEEIDGMVTMTLKKGNVATSHTLGAADGLFIGEESAAPIVLSKNGTYNLKWKGNDPFVDATEGTYTMDFFSASNALSNPFFPPPGESHCVGEGG